MLFDQNNGCLGHLFGLELCSLSPVAEKLLLFSVLFVLKLSVAPPTWRCTHSVGTRQMMLHNDTPDHTHTRTHTSPDVRFPVLKPVFVPGNNAKKMQQRKTFFLVKKQKVQQKSAKKCKKKSATQAIFCPI